MDNVITIESLCGTLVLDMDKTFPCTTNFLGFLVRKWIRPSSQADMAALMIHNYLEDRLLKLRFKIRVFNEDPDYNQNKEYCRLQRNANQMICMMEKYHLGGYSNAD